MIAGCPNCQARYRVDRDKLVDGAVRLRCTKCESVFRVRAPEEPSLPPVEAAPVPQSAAPIPQSAAPIPQEPAPQLDSPSLPDTPPAPAPSVVPTGETVMIAVPDVELGKRTADVLAANGIAAIVVQDGVDAMLEVQRRLPQVVVLAADLPKMFGFQVCEVIQRNESLSHIHVILAGAIHHPDRYRRPPEEIYGADDYIEAPELPETIMELLQRAGFGAGVGGLGTDVSPAPQPTPVVPASPSPVPTLEEPAPISQSSAPLPQSPAPLPQSAAPVPQSTAPVATPALEVDPPPVPVEPALQPAPQPVAPPAVPDTAVAPGLDEERAKAERLARIIVSDIILYNDEKFARALAAGNVGEALGPDLVEGRGLFDERIDARVRGEQDYLMAELLRVARLRGME